MKCCEFTEAELAELAVFDAEIDAQPGWDKQELIEARKRDSEAKAQFLTTAQQRVRESQKRYKEQNKEKLKLKRREYYLKNRERELARGKEYRDSHREQLKERQDAYDDAHREQRRAASKRWRDNNPDKVKAYYLANKEKRDRQSLEWYYTHKPNANAEPAGKSQRTSRPTSAKGGDNKLST